MRRLRSSASSKNKVIGLLVALFTSFSFCFGQDDSAIDSLETVLTQQTQDTSRIKALNDLAAESYASDPQAAIVYGERALLLSDSIDYLEGKALALKNIGLGYYFEQDYLRVLESWQESLEVYESLGDENGISNLLNNLGAIYFNQGDNAKALEYWLRSLQIAEDLGDEFRIASALVNVSLVYVNLEKYETSLDYSRRSLHLSEKIQDSEAIGLAAVNTGEIFFKTGQMDSALVYFEESIEAYEGTVHLPYSLNYIGKVYDKKGEFDQAIDFQERALEMARSYNENMLITQVLVGLGDTYSHARNYRMALQNYLSAEESALDIGADIELKDAYAGLSSSYAQLGEYENAFKYQTAFAQIKDTLYNLETSDKVRGVQFSYEIDKKQSEIDLLEAEKQIQDLESKRQSAITTGISVVGGLLLLLAFVLYRRYKFANKTKKVIEYEKSRSDNLLLNILPAETAEELKAKGEAEAKQYDSVSILFTDFKGFTSISANLSPKDLVKEIHECYKMFDIITARHKIEKIKTIGDAYMAAGGLPIVNNSHPLDVAKAAVEIKNYMAELKVKRIAEGRPFFEIRIGIHTGPVVAGIVGIKKFAYDIWGDTVNIASRMESNSEAGKINISEQTYEAIKEHYHCSYRGEIDAKNRGKLKMYFLEDSNFQEEQQQA